MVKKGSGLRLAVLLLTLFLCVGCFIGLGNEKVFAADIIDSGSYNDWCSWEVDSDGLLRIFSFQEGLESKKWSNRTVKKVIVEDGVQVSNDSHNSSRFLFANLYHCIEMDLSGLDTSNVTDMAGMFQDCWELVKLDISNFDTSNVTDMSNMFYRCNNLTELDISGFNTSKVTNMRSMFYSCYSLKELNVSNFDTSNVTNMARMFYMCRKLTELNVSNFNTSNVTNMASMLNSCSGLTELDVSGFDTSKVTNMYGMFGFSCSGCDSGYTVGCYSLTELDVSNFDTSNVTNMSCMFAGCRNLAKLDVSGFNTSKVTDMSCMFNYCSKLTELNVGSFNTGNVTDMTDMFYSCIKLTELDLSNFNISNVVSISFPSSRSEDTGMFANCYNLSKLDISSFESSSVANMKSTFKNCNSLTTVTFSGSFQFVGTDHGFNLNNWVKTRNADGSKTYDKTEYTAAQLTALTADTTPSIGGTWCRFGVEDYTQNADGSIEYISADDSWDIISDNVWSYTFKVFDDSLVYRLFEDIMNGYAS